MAVVPVEGTGDERDHLRTILFPCTGKHGRARVAHRGERMPHTCCFTNKRANFGSRKKSGECAMTKIAYDDAGAESDGGSIAYTVCNHCHQYACCACWELVAAQFDELSRSNRCSVLSHDVWHITD